MSKALIFSAALALVCLMAGSGLAQGIGFNGIGGDVGFVKPESIDGTIGFGAHFNLGELFPNFILFPSIDYWSKSQTVDTGFGSFSADFSQTTINGDLRYNFPGSGEMVFFGGGGLAIQFNDPGDSKLGLNVLGGLDFPLSNNLMFTGIAKYVIADFSVFKVFGGVTYKLGE